MWGANFQSYLDGKTKEYYERWRREELLREKQRQEQEAFNSLEWEGILDQVRSAHGLNFKEISFTYDKTLNPDRKIEAFCVMKIEQLGSLNLHLRNTSQGWLIESAVGEMWMDGAVQVTVKVADVQEAIVRMHMAKKVRERG